MIIKKTSAFSGIVRTKDIPMDPKDFAQYEAGYGSMDDLLPYLSIEDREFILEVSCPKE